MWYFAQPFRDTGALVLMIYNIARDCVAFLCLSFIVLFGFGLALHVLFRGISASTEEDVSNARDDFIQDEDSVAASAAFGTFKQSLVTLFYALLGAFEPEVTTRTKSGHIESYVCRSFVWEICLG